MHLEESGTEAEGYGDVSEFTDKMGIITTQECISCIIYVLYMKMGICTKDAFGINCICFGKQFSQRYVTNLIVPRNHKFRNAIVINVMELGQEV